MVGLQVGFDEKELEIAKNREAPLPVDLEAGFYAMYLYTDIVEPRNGLKTIFSDFFFLYSLIEL